MPRPRVSKRLRAILIAALVLELGAIAGFLAYRRVGGANRCFPQTGACVEGAFARHWAAGGGLDRFGYPLTGELDEAGADGRTRRVQYFARARFEVRRRGPRPLGSVADHPLDGYAALGRSPGGAPAATPRFDPQRLTLELEEVARGLRQPLFVAHAGDGSGRLFVVEKGGTIRTLPGAAGGELFLDIADRVGSSGSEQGLLGLAFHPRFRENGHFYVNYTDRNGDTVIARYTTAPDRRSADAASERRLIFQDQPAANHNGGMLVFGPDGYLYVGLGDGGGGNDVFRNAQNRGSLLGKLLRLDVDRGDPYAIPPDNPFVGDRAARPEVWAYGLRNPWRFSFDRATADLYIADVGQNRYEWVHYQPAGRGAGQDYGWPTLEGSHCLYANTCDRSGRPVPVAEYDHSLGCTIVGGYVYRGARQPLLQGAYLFGDYCSGRIWGLGRDGAGRWVSTELLKANAAISSFGEDEAGELYLTDLRRGGVYRLTAVPR